MVISKEEEEVEVEDEDEDGGKKKRGSDCGMRKFVYM